MVQHVSRTSEALIAGWAVELAGSTAQNGYGGFTYARSPAGILFEPERDAKELFPSTRH